MLKKLIKVLISLVILYNLTEWIIRGIYVVLIQSNKYITFGIPMIHLTKYFTVAIVLIYLFRRYSTLTAAGEKLMSLFLIISISGLLITSLWFNAVHEDKFIKYRIAWLSTHTWDEVDYVESKISSKLAVSQYTPPKVSEKYDIHFKDGSVINAWENVSSVYQLHKLVLTKNIDVTYNKKELESFEQNYSSYFRKEMPEATFIFYGVEDKD